MLSDTLLKTMYPVLHHSKTQRRDIKMKTNEQLKATGKLDIQLIGPDGALKEKVHVPNLVVTAGRNFIVDRMLGTSDGVMSHMAIGTDGTAAALGDTALGSESHRNAFDATPTDGGNTITYETTFDPGQGTAALQEAGIFNASTAGTMLCRTTFDVVNKAAGDTMIITWTVTIS